LTNVYSNEKDVTTDKNICPECGAKLVFQEGCRHCLVCGWGICL